MAVLAGLAAVWMAPGGAAAPGEPAAGAAAPDTVVRGRYVFQAAGCAGCHTDRKGKGALLAGGRKLETPFGVFYSPNITPDPEHGIGRWSDADFIRALRLGVAPDGSHYFPVFPYPAYTRITDRDLRDLKAYIFSLPPVARPNRPHEVDPPFGWRFLVPAWKWLYFTPGPLRADPRRSDQWNRGAYLVEALGHCAECHTPRGPLGGFKAGMALAGNPEGPDGALVPNITPDEETGIGRWSASDVETVLTLGMRPDGDFVESGMDEVVENTTGRLTPADLDAIMAYLKSLPPVHNDVRAKKQAGQGRAGESRERR